ncbi:MAG: type II toxin-antitoxin system Phd/YefM family antitoxin [Rhodothermales bacterium]
MQRINLAQDVHPLSAFRKRASALIDQVQQTRRPLVLTRNGKSAAIVLDIREFEQMVERLELLEDVHVAREQARRGETVPQEQALAYLTARLHTTSSTPENE